MAGSRKNSDFRTNNTDLTLILPKNLYTSEPALCQRQFVINLIQELIYEMDDLGLIPSSSNHFFHIGMKEQEIKENGTMLKSFVGEVYLRFVDPVIAYTLLGLDNNGQTCYTIKETIKKRCWSANGETQILTEKIPQPTFVPTYKYGEESIPLSFTKTTIDRNKYDDKKGIRYYQEADTLVTSLLPKDTTIEEIMFLIRDVSPEREINGIIYPFAEYITPTISDLKVGVTRKILTKDDLLLAELLPENYELLKSKYKKIKITFEPNSSEAAFVKQLFHRNEIEGKGEQRDFIFDVFFSRECVYTEKTGNFMERRSR